MDTHILETWFIYMLLCCVISETDRATAERSPSVKHTALILYSSVSGCLAV